MRAAFSAAARRRSRRMHFPHPPGHHRSSGPRPPRISSAIALDRSKAEQLRGRVDVPISPSPRCSRLIDQRELHRAIGEATMTPTPHRHSEAARVQPAAAIAPHRPSGAPSWVACDPSTSPLRPDCDRVSCSRSQTGTFRCALVRTFAQAFCLHSANSRASSLSTYRVEAAGIEPASAAAPSERLRA